ncbi:uncharacterized protein LOC121739955 isoform X2 [Aricia agestis]|uniref:uncharacterized protein LOC121739955 isoform X2 n=1 Tax=Aricia agestis TaxID=91739 RepID=UPI001C203AC0|nr:uncharacterized protein LOC121739955 isoform X2 [Aricia agestis]
MPLMPLCRSWFPRATSYTVWVPVRILVYGLNGDGCTLAGERAALVAEYLARTERLAPLFPRLPRARPLPLAYQSPPNLALELTKSILYENIDSIDLKTLKSLNSQSESLWNGKPQQYFESMKYGSGEDEREFEDDSLA